LSDSVERAIRLMREAQQLLESDSPVLAAHLETVIGIAVEQSCDAFAPEVMAG
jgi:hypothetical protein